MSQIPQILGALTLKGADEYARADSRNEVEVRPWIIGLFQQVTLRPPQDIFSMDPTTFPTEQKHDSNGIAVAR